MDIKFSQYIGATKVKLSAHDAPMTAIRALTNAFVSICTNLEEGEPAISVGVDSSSGPDHSAVVTMQDGKVVGMETYPSFVKADQMAAEAALEEAPRKRGRPRKVPETVEDVPAVAEEVAQEAPPLESPASFGDTPAPETVATESSPETETATSAEATNTDEPAEITDTDLNRYCHRLAAHFGAPQKVFDLAAKFVPAGAVHRPTNIRNHADRAKFIAEAEEASGIRYHG